MSLTKFTILLLVGCFLGLTSFTHLSSIDNSTYKTLDPFSHIQLSGAYNVEIIQGDEYAIEIEGHKSAAEAVNAQVSNGSLRISLHEPVKYAKDILVKISVKELESISVSGANKIISKDKLVVDNMELKVSGATKVILELEANHIEATTSGVSNTVLTGNTNSLCVKLSGVSKLNTFDLGANSVNLLVSGASKADVRSNQELDIRASGVSSVSYKGDPEKIEKRVSRTSRVKQI